MKTPMATALMTAGIGFILMSMIVMLCVMFLDIEDKIRGMHIVITSGIGGLILFGISDLYDHLDKRF